MCKAKGKDHTAPLPFAGIMCHVRALRRAFGAHNWLDDILAGSPAHSPNTTLTLKGIAETASIAGQNEESIHDVDHGRKEI